MLTTISKLKGKNGLPATLQERLDKLNQMTASGDDIRASRNLDMAYELFTLGDTYIDKAIEIMDRYGVVEKKVKTTANNLMQSFDSFDKATHALFSTQGDKRQFCDNVDILREVCEAFTQFNVTIKRGPYLAPTLFLPTKQQQ